MTDEEAKTLGELALKADMLRRQCRDIEEKMKEQRARHHHDPGIRSGDRCMERLIGGNHDKRRSGRSRPSDDGSP